jgi:hypothetical protein
MPTGLHYNNKAINNDRFNTSMMIVPPTLGSNGFVILYYGLTTVLRLGPFRKLESNPLYNTVDNNSVSIFRCGPQ